MKRPLIFVAGPLVGGAGSEDMMVNVRAAIDFGRDILDKGGLPFVPHNFVFWHFLEAGPRELWMEADLAYIEHCEAFVRLHGPSKGADDEVAAAKDLGLRVFNFEVDDYSAHRAFWAWLKSRVPE